MNNNVSKSKIDLLIVSCDSYSDVWAPFFNSLFHFWKDCPLKIYLLSNYKSYNHSNVIPIKVGQDISWSDNLMNALEELNSTHVFILLDDLLINQKISKSYFNTLSNWITNNDPNYLRLCISHKPDYFDDLVGQIPIITPYKTSTMPCIWKKSVLKDLLREGESAWDFEINGSRRAYKYNGFYAVYNDFVTYKNSIIKGKWRRGIINECNNYGLDINDLSRPVMTLGDKFEYCFLKLRSKLFNKLPNKFRSILRG